MQNSVRDALILALGLGLLCAACSSSSDDGGGTGGNAPSSGAAGQAGGSGAALDMYCEKFNADTCDCLQDKNNHWGPQEGTDPCSTETVGLGHGFCCASDDYPNTGDCMCQAWGCFEGNQCTCNIVYTDQEATSCVKPWRHCCQESVGGRVYSCNCSNFECLESEDEVPSCGLDNARCPAGQHRVENCRP